jgi:hypothetical protein
MRAASPSRQHRSERHERPRAQATSIVNDTLRQLERVPGFQRLVWLAIDFQYFDVGAFDASMRMATGTSARRNLGNYAHRLIAPWEVNCLNRRPLEPALVSGSGRYQCHADAPAIAGSGVGHRIYEMFAGIEDQKNSFVLQICDQTGRCIFRLNCSH